MPRFLVIFLILILSSCIEVNKDYKTVVIDNTKSNKVIAQSNEQFESRDLKDITHHKKRLKVALLLPVTGKNKILGNALLNSATFSLFENDNKNNIELILFDSASTKKDIKNTFKDIIDQDIKIVIGPIFSHEVEKIVQEAILNEIIVISLSNDQKLINNIDHNGGVFLAGMIPEVQIDKIVSYAIGSGKTSFAVIAPNNQYGIMTAALYKKMVKDRDGIFVTSELYSANGKGINNAVKRAVNAFSVPSNLAEGGGNILEDDFIVEDIDKTYAQVILVPDSGKKLAQIARRIQHENTNLRDIKIIGTSQWDDVSTLGNIVLMGGWFAAPANEKFREYERKYYQSFSKFPPRISSIIYDAIASIAKIIDKKKDINLTLLDFTKFSDDNLNGFSGIDGVFRYNNNGLVQRNLAILEVGQGKFEVIEAPDEDFML